MRIAQRINIDDKNYYYAFPLQYEFHNLPRAQFLWNKLSRKMEAREKK